MRESSRGIFSDRQLLFQFVIYGVMAGWLVGTVLKPEHLEKTQIQQMIREGRIAILLFGLLQIIGAIVGVMIALVAIAKICRETTMKGYDYPPFAHPRLLAMSASIGTALGSYLGHASHLRLLEIVGAIGCTIIFPTVLVIYGFRGYEEAELQRRELERLLSKSGDTNKDEELSS